MCVCPAAPGSVVVTTTLAGLGGQTSTATMTYYPAGSPPAYPGMPATAAHPTPAYYTALATGPTNQGVTSYTYNYIQCFANGFSMAGVTYNNFGNVVENRSSWNWTIGQGGSTCSPFLLAGGTPANPSDPSNPTSITVSG